MEAVDVMDILEEMRRWDELINRCNELRWDVHEMSNYLELHGTLANDEKELADRAWSQLAVAHEALIDGKNGRDIGEEAPPIDLNRKQPTGAGAPEVDE